MKRLIAFTILGILLVGVASAYFFIQEDDNEQVKMFKSNVNKLALEQEVKNEVTPEAFEIKYKYFIKPFR